MKPILSKRSALIRRASVAVSPLALAATRTPNPKRVGCRHTRSTLLLLFSALAGTAHAQWFQTTYALKGGWNAIHLHGDATHATPDVLFPNSGQTAGVQEIWRWNPKPNQVQFTASPLIPSAGTLEWNVWKRPVPPALIHPDTNLSIISGQTAYLVKCSGTAATAWNVPVLQRAMPPSATWVRAGANLLGFPSKFTTPNYPSFSTYFQSFPAALAANAKVFKYVGGDLGAANPLQIFSPTLEPVDRDKAYWFESEVVGNFFAPLDISLTQSTGLDFGRTGSVITARLRNTTAANMTLTLTPAFSLAAPAGQPPIVPNTMVPLTRRTFNAVNGTWTETLIAGAYTEVIGANSTVELSFGINRTLMSGASNLYASLLRLTDSGNLFDIALPVSARVASLAGLWIGDATVTDVSSQVQATATATATVKNGVLTGITVTGGGGFGYDTVPVPVIAAPTATATATVTLSPGVTAAATALLTGGVVTGYTITNVGSGYTAPPLISIAAPPVPGTTATATAVLTGGTVTGITISNGGSGYAAAPAITIGGAGTMTAITITNPGAGYITTPSVTIGFPILGVRALATATVSNGLVTGLTITNPGSGYGATTTVVISQPTLGTATAVVTRSPGTPATATAVLTGGVVTGINITNGGSLYSDAPAIAIAAPPSGTRATATAVVTNGVLTGITIDDGGSGYTAVPAVTIGGRTIASITLTNPGSGYTIPPTVTIAAPAGGLGTRATAVATVRDGIITGLVLSDGGSEYDLTPGVNITSPPPGTAPAAANAVISGGTVSSISVSNPGAGYYSPPAITIAPPASGTTATAVAVVGNGGITGITILTPGSGYTATPVVTIAAAPAPIAAVATPITKGGKVTGFIITNAGRGYRAAPAITIPAPAPLGTRTARTPPLRVILHVDDSGTARLLSQVFIGTLDATGAQGLCTSESGLLAAGKANASRIVAAHLPLDRVLATGTGSASATGAQPLIRSVSIPFDDKTNPFVHRYHPDHDNKDARGAPLDAGFESYDITRTFSFRFTTTPPAGVSTIGWGSTAIGGDYSEVVKGLHKQDLTATGTFVLRRASEIGTLTVQ